MAGRVAFLGPRGTFTEQAALLYHTEAELVPFPTVSAVADAVGTGVVDEGVVAIENSLEGAVNETLDVLIQETSLFIRHELTLPVDHCLLAKPGTPVEEVQVIYSHPQALGQCRQFLSRRFPGAQRIAALSTTTAVEQMKDSDVPAAAVATRRAADLYDVDVVAEAIQDAANNVTRFIVLARQDRPHTGDDKTSIWFTFTEDHPGLLYSILGEFANRGINLAKVESRPTKESLGRYIFLVDLEGHRDDPLVREALDAVDRQVAAMRVMGSYPRWRSQASA